MFPNIIVGTTVFGNLVVVDRVHPMAHKHAQHNTWTLLAHMIVVCCLAFPNITIANIITVTALKARMILFQFLPS